MVASTSLKEYLKRYETNNEEEKKKKKKKKKSKPVASTVCVVDVDPIWQKLVKPEEESSDELAEEKPQVDEDIEVKRMKRLEQLRLRQPYHAISEDGSGWVPISDAPRVTDYNNISPPPKPRTCKDTPSPEPNMKHLGFGSNSDRDLSRPRQHRSTSPEHRPENGRGGTDMSPPRRRRHHSPSLDSHQPSEFGRGGTDMSPPRRRRHHSPSLDFHQPLKFGSGGTDMSPPRRRRHHSPSPDSHRPSEFGRGLDMSPRRSRHRHSPSPDSHRPSEFDREGTDLSPPQQQKRHVPAPPKVSDNTLDPEDLNASCGPDLSSPRKNRKKLRRPGSPDLSPPRSDRRLTGPSQSSSVSDLSPPRRNRKEKPPLKEQSKTGLVTGKDIKEENEKTRKDDWLRFKEMDPSISGRGAEPIYRDKLKGERISKNEFLKLKKKEEKPKEIKLEWGKGLAQKREAEARQLELELEKNKPFARSRDDPDLDKMLKNRVRWGDPMAHLVKAEPVLPDLGSSETMKASGFIIPQDVPSHSWIRRGLDAAPNRYGIRPGRHWDGVDRSNGFEKELFKRMNEKQATEREAYLWSVSDM